MTAFGTLEMLGDESISLLQKLDVEGEYKGLADYVAEAESQNYQERHQPLFVVSLLLTQSIWVFLYKGILDEWKL